MGSFYRSKHELVFIWKSGTAPHINTFELGQHGRHRTNVWDYDGVNTIRPGRLDELAMHPTVKPVALVADAIRDCSRRGYLVLDPFCGSGTILVAAEKTGRIARAIEIDPGYVDVAIRRWQTYTGKVARLSAASNALTEERRGFESGVRYIAHHYFGSSVFLSKDSLTGLTTFLQPAKSRPLCAITGAPTLGKAG